MVAKYIREINNLQEHPFCGIFERERERSTFDFAGVAELDGKEIPDANDTAALLKKEPGTVPTGVGCLPKGAVYAQQEIVVKGITSEMLDWWYAFYPLDSDRYMMWMPESHHSLGIADCDAEKILNPLVPPSYKTRGIILALLRDEGRGLKEVNIRMQDPHNVGFDMGSLREYGVANVYTDWTMSQSLDCLALPNRFPFRSYSVNISVVRDIPEGISVLAYSWLGYRYDCDGIAFHFLPPGVEIPTEAGKGTLAYAKAELEALAEFLPVLYEKNGRKINKKE